MVTAVRELWILRRGREVRGKNTPRLCGPSTAWAVREPKVKDGLQSQTIHVRNLTTRTVKPVEAQTSMEIMPFKRRAPLTNAFGWLPNKILSQRRKSPISCHISWYKPWRPSLTGGIVLHTIANKQLQWACPLLHPVSISPSYFIAETQDRMYIGRDGRNLLFTSPFFSFSFSYWADFFPRTPLISLPLSTVFSVPRYVSRLIPPFKPIYSNVSGDSYQETIEHFIGTQFFCSCSMKEGAWYSQHSWELHRLDAETFPKTILKDFHPNLTTIQSYPMTNDFFLFSWASSFIHFLRLKANEKQRFLLLRSSSNT